MKRKIWVKRTIAVMLSVTMAFGIWMPASSKEAEQDEQIIGETVNRMNKRQWNNTEASALVERLVDWDAVIPSVNEVTTDEGFIHPGIAVTKEHLDTMQQMVRNKQEPWLSGFERFYNTTIENTGRAKRNPFIYYNSNPQLLTYVGADSAQSAWAGNAARTDADTAFRQIIMWYITGDEGYRATAISILRKYSGMVSAVEHYDSQIYWGTAVYKFCAAAEIVKYTKCNCKDASCTYNWTEEDDKKFCNMLGLLEKFYDSAWRWMNQHQLAQLASFGAAIFKEDRDFYETVVERTMVNKDGDNGGQNGSIKHQFRAVDRNLLTGEAVDPPNIQIVEMGRDMGHAWDDAFTISQLSQIIYNQNTLVDPEYGTVTEKKDGVDPFDFLNQRVLKGLNYICKYNLGYPVTYVPCAINASGTEYYSEIASGLRGRFDDGFGLAYMHYKYIKGIDMNGEDARYLARAYETMIPEKDCREVLGSADLLYTPACVAEENTYNKYETFDYTNAKREAENVTAVLYGSASIKTDTNGTKYVRADATGDGTGYAIRYGTTTGKGVISIRVRTNGKATIGYATLDSEREPYCEFEIPDTNGEWHSYTCDISDDARINDSHVTYLYIHGDATAVDVDGLYYQDEGDMTNLYAEESTSEKIVYYPVGELTDGDGKAFQKMYDESERKPGVALIEGKTDGSYIQIPMWNQKNVTSIGFSGKIADEDTDKNNKVTFCYEKDETETQTGLKLNVTNAYITRQLLSGISHGDEVREADQWYLCWGPSGNVYMEYVVVKYARTDADNALSEVLSRAEALDESADENKFMQSDEYKRALQAANLLSVSRTDDMEQALTASEEQIQAAADQLEAILDSGITGVAVLSDVVDEDAYLRGSTLTVPIGSTAAYCNAGKLITSPKNSVFTVYKDDTMEETVTDDTLLEAGNVLMVSAQGCGYSLYTIAIQKEMEHMTTTGTETETEKVIRYAAADLIGLYNNTADSNRGITKDTYEQVDRVAFLSGWGFSVPLYFPTENVKNIIDVKAEVRTSWINTQTVRNPLLVLCCEDAKGNETVTGLAEGYYDGRNDLRYEESVFTNYLAQEAIAKAEKVWFRYGTAYGGINIKSITITYKKTEADRELDALITEADKISNPSAQLRKALQTAKQYKITTADDVFSAATSTEEDIQAVVRDLKIALDAEGNRDIIGITSQNTELVQVANNVITTAYEITVGELLNVLQIQPATAICRVYKSNAMTEELGNTEPLYSGNVLYVTTESEQKKFSIVVKEQHELPLPAVYFDFEDYSINGWIQGQGAAALMMNQPSVKDSEINGTATKAVKYERNGTNSSYLQLFDSTGSDAFTQLDGEKEFTITWWEKAEDESTSWAFFISNKNKAASDYMYLGAISKSTSIRAAKKDQSTTMTAASGWRHVAMVFTTKKVDCYVNGTWIGSVSQLTMLPNIIGKSPIAYLGYSLWREGANLWMDEFKIYKTALTESQIQEDYAIIGRKTMGDVNRDGKIDTQDVEIVLQAASGEGLMNNKILSYGDMNGDGQITAVDALLISKNIE